MAEPVGPPQRSRVGRARRLAIALPLALPLATSTSAQDFPDTQRLTSRLLFAKEEVDARRREAERRRVDELDRQTRQQAAQLQEQARSVQQLGSELQSIRDERVILDLVASFETAIASGDLPLARALLASAVVVDLEGPAPSAAAPIAADDVIARLAALTAKGGVSPRADNRVRVEGERATLTATGFAWGHADRAGRGLGRYAGELTYGLARTPDGWKIDSISFRPASSMPASPTAPVQPG